MTTRVVGDTAILTGRSLRHILRSPDTVITTTLMPIAFMLLFVYVFGGAISQGSGSARYVTYLLPGILLITIASSVSYAAFRLFTDLQSGIFERLLSMPIARSSVLWAHVLTSLVASLVSVGSGSPWSWASAPARAWGRGWRSPASWSCLPWR
jgi:ABC-2 type transport system permease protein